MSKYKKLVRATITPAEKELAQLIIDGDFENAQSFEDCGLEFNSTVMSAIAAPVTHGLKVSDPEKAGSNAMEYFVQKMGEGMSEEDLSSMRKQRASRLMLMEWAKKNGHEDVKRLTDEVVAALGFGGVSEKVEISGVPKPVQYSKPPKM